MAVQHTQGKWTIYSSNAGQHQYVTDFRIICGDKTVCSISHLSKEYSESFDRQTPEANAALICDAVNNTAGKGINPNAVPELLKVLEIISQHAYDDDTPESDILADFDNMRGLAINAINATKLK